MAEGDTLVNSILGAVVTVVTASFVPFSPVFGGLLAGYLEGGGRDDGIRIGVISGAIALVPFVVVAVFVVSIVSVFLLGTMMGPGRVFGGLGFLALGFVFVFAAVYTVGLSALGGWLGNYIRHDTDIGDS